MMSDESYPALAQFFGGYFHQDWDLEATNWQGLVEKFCAAAQRKEIAAVGSELKALLAGAHDERELSEFVFSRMGCAYDPSVDGLSVRDWIMELRRCLVAAVPGLPP